MYRAKEMERKADLRHAVINLIAALKIKIRRQRVLYCETYLGNESCHKIWKIETTMQLGTIIQP